MTQVVAAYATSYSVIGGVWHLCNPAQIDSVVSSLPVVNYLCINLALENNYKPN